MDKEKILRLLEEIKKEVENGDTDIKTNGRANSSVDNNVNNSNIRDLIVSEALKFNQTGIYKYGGSGYENILKDGVDCSGFVHAIFNHCGIKVERMSSLWYSKMGKEKKRPEPGDLIFYGNPINHMAIYIGDGKIINHGSTPTKIIKYDYKPITTIRDFVGG